MPLYNDQYIDVYVKYSGNTETNKNVIKFEEKKRNMS